jgi:hypothetical protein
MASEARKAKRAAQRAITKLNRQGKRAERREWGRLLGEHRADELLAACDQARREHDLCRCPGGVNLRHYASQAEADADKATWPAEVCGLCGKERPRIGLVEERSEYGR